MIQMLAQSISKLMLYQDKVPLFTRYQIEHQIETAHRREVPLRSGGALVVDHTEALTAIDINSARSTGGSDIEETATNTNLEACDEIGRQLRLRDLGGLIVIDFIDMMKSGNQRAVEDRLRDAVKHDRARIQLGKLSRFGLLEMSRQRLRPSLKETSHITCPRCEGQGTIRSVESTALHVLRLLEEESLKERTGRLAVQVPVAVATYLFNEKRDAVSELGERLGVNPIILPNPALETPHYELDRTRVQDLNKRLLDTPSHELTLTVPAPEAAAAPAAIVMQPAAVQRLVRSTPPPIAAQGEGMADAAPTPQAGLLARLWRSLVGSQPPAPVQAPQRHTRNRQPRNETPAGRHDRDSRPEREARPDRGRQGGNAQKRPQAPAAPRTPQAAREGQRDPSVLRDPAGRDAPREPREGKSGRSRGRRGGQRGQGQGGGEARNASAEAQPRAAQPTTPAPSESGVAEPEWGVSVPAAPVMVMAPVNVAPALEPAESQSVSFEPALPVEPVVLPQPVIDDAEPAQEAPPLEQAPTEPVMQFEPAPPVPEPEPDQEPVVDPVVPARVAGAASSDFVQVETVVLAAEPDKDTHTG